MAQNATKNDAETPFARLADRAAGNQPQGYAGEITSEEVHEFLSANPGVLVDVRTSQEWSEGRPDVSRTQGKLALLSWKTQPNYTLNPDFKPEFEKANIPKDTPLFFMCKGGGRSLEAAKTMTEAGYRYCFNVTGGFKGRHDMVGNVIAQGWEASGLPSKKGAL